jgi:DNA repair photolyase
MIVSASRRTDIPAFFSDWFFNRIDDGFLFARNPMNPHQISRISLSPAVVDCIVFWSKNPKRMIERLHLLDRYNYYFQFTITAYGQLLEPNVPTRDEAIDIFNRLSRKIGKNRVVWRYDPIILADNIDIKYHVASFEYIAKQLFGKTRRCVISFLDLYKKTIRNISSVSVTDITVEMMIDLARALSILASRYGIELVSCAEEIDLVSYGIKHGKCIDDKLIEEVFGFALQIEKDKTQRAECGCVASVDIGSYNTCPHGCLYCYANFSPDKVRLNYALHNPHSPLLFGEIKPGDKITDRKVISCKAIQQKLL